MNEVGVIAFPNDGCCLKAGLQLFHGIGHENPLMREFIILGDDMTQQGCFKVQPGIRRTRRVPSSSPRVACRQG